MRNWTVTRILQGLSKDNRRLKSWHRTQTHTHTGSSGAAAKIVLTQSLYLSVLLWHAELVNFRAFGYFGLTRGTSNNYLLSNCICKIHTHKHKYSRSAACVCVCVLAKCILCLVALSMAIVFSHHQQYQHRFSSLLLFFCKFFVLLLLLLLLLWLGPSAVNGFCVALRACSSQHCCLPMLLLLLLSTSLSTSYIHTHTHTCEFMLACVCVSVRLCPGCLCQF